MLYHTFIVKACKLCPVPQLQLLINSSASYMNIYNEKAGTFMLP
ncbi:Hypothetical protein EUBREC_0612 [Agathobacter rectalis ATCC 33656]|uniref:Uncharacterized protein n=1 Tax=Agathobacter rectalis (strain ATCC 33656 / DSM 3377 / JCM 17463 / KCTC 5835 / VPI 0990) TaxID=515619 RepID=C4ZCP6_AGARV|nr:Hypothetical protein EUBREC_0612 [Agathobacter rectalis ATCC 33656]